jgi:hypothetical protein
MIKKVLVFLCAVMLVFGMFGMTYATLIDNNDSTVPEPATILLLGTGLFGLAVIGRKDFLGKVPMQMMELPDNGGRRSDRDRRSFLYALNIPEMRSGKDRRSGFDRRKETRYKI